MTGTDFAHQAPLTDSFGRRVTYLRISLTDRCDLRCLYCMSEDMTFVPRAQLLTLEEVLLIARAFTGLGVNKIRITGGEPLVRRNALWLLSRLGRLLDLKELVLTTNGTQLTRYARALKAAGVARLNVSLDSLRPERFRRMTRVGNLETVLDGIESARRAGFRRIKLNTVVLRGHNHDEVVDLLRFALAQDLDIAFIEEMPLGLVSSHDRAAAFYSSDEILDDLQRHYELLPTTESTGGPARYFRIPGRRSRIGFISPHSHNFCDRCNRVRLTPEGRLLLCLGQEHSLDLRRVVRAHPGALEPVQRAIVRAMERKPAGHDFRLTEQPVIFRHMNATGG